VSGGQHSVVMPAAAAALVSLAMVAFCSSPGWRRRAHRSTSPGQTTSPLGVDDAFGREIRGASPSARMRGPAMCRSVDRVDAVGRVDDATAADAQGLASLHHSAID
jgi:hypothetical protein